MPNASRAARTPESPYIIVLLLLFFMISLIRGTSECRCVFERVKLTQGKILFLRPKWVVSLDLTTAKRISLCAHGSRR